MPDIKSQGPTCRRCDNELDIIIPEVPASPVPHAFEQEFYEVTAAEGHEVRRTVDQVRKDGVYLDRSIARLESLLRDCQKARELHEAFEQRHSPLLKSAHRLPNEVWTEIFNIASDYPIESEPSEYVFLSATPSSAPLSLSHVSTQWRSIALQSPSLWSNIDIAVRTSFPSSKLNLLSMFFARSSSHPLEVYSDFLEDQDGDHVNWDSLTSVTKKTFLRALEILTLQSRRWKTVSLGLPSKVYGGPPFPIPSTPILRYLTLETSDCISERTDWSPVFLSHAPMLETITVFNFLPSSAECLASMIPWTSLTEVNLRGFTDGVWGFEAEDTLQILRSCGHLQKFNLTCHNGSTTARILHPSLQELSLTCPSSWLLSVFTAPELKTLHLNLMCPDNSDDMVLFLERSPNLKRLKLQDSDLDILHRPELFQRSQISDLEIIISFLAEDTASSIEQLEEFSRREWQDIRTLKSLQITLSSDKEDEEYLVQGMRLASAIAMVAERFRVESKPPCSLQSLTISVNQGGISDLALETFKYLKHLDCSGLSVFFDGEELNSKDSNSNGI